MKSGIILLFIVLFVSSVSAAPQITSTSGELSNTNRIIISGNNFGVGPDTAQTAFLGGANGWPNQQPAGTHLKDMTPFSTGQQSEWTYIYPGYGYDDLVSSEAARVPGKNQLLLQTGGLTPSVMYDSTFGLSTDNPQQTFFISFWVRQHIQDINFETVNCLPGYTDPRENETIYPQNKFFSLASKARPGEPGVVYPNNYGSNRNQWVIGSGRVEERNGQVVRREGFGGEWYTHHGDPDFSYDSPTNSYNICNINKQIGPVGASYLYATHLTGIGGYNGQSCQPYDWGWHAGGGPATDALNKALDFDEWVKLQIWMKAGEFDTYDDKLIFQILKENGLHEKTVNLENANFFTQIWGDNGEFTHPALFYFYGYFAQDYSAYENISGVITKTCQGESTGWLKTYVDDFYIQPGSWAHIELGDAPLYEDTTILEIQKPVSWSANLIELELNTGFFNPGDDAWLFVIDANGDPSPGYHIVVQDYTQGAVCWDNQQNGDETGVDCGGSCPNACPSCTDGLQNQDELGVDCGGSCPNQCPLEGDIIVLQNNPLDYSGQVDACIGGNSPDRDTHFNQCSVRNDFTQKNHMFKFDLSALPSGRTIQSAKLYLNEIESGSQANSDIRIRKITKDWDSNTVTWNSFSPDASSFVEPIVAYAANQQPIPVIDITSWAQEWYTGNNYGFVIDQINTAAYVEIGYDNYGNLDLRPKLEVIFEPDNVTQPQDPLLMYSSMSSVDTIWHPEVHQEAYATSTEAVPGYPNMVSFVPGQVGTAVKFTGNTVAYDGPLGFPVGNFDFDDLEGDGGRIDFLVRIDKLPIPQNVWMARSSWPRYINFEWSGGNLMIDVYSDYPLNDRTFFTKFRNLPGASANTPTNEWHWFTWTWKRNGLHQDEMQFYIDGQSCPLCVSYNGDLPPIGGITDFFFSPIQSQTSPPYMNFSVDEVYSFSSWDTQGLEPVTLNIPEGVTMHFPMADDFPYPPSVPYTQHIAFEFSVKNDVNPSFTCDVYVDGSFVEAVSTTNRAHNEVLYPGVLNPGTHNWEVRCDGNRLTKSSTFIIDIGDGSCENGIQDGIEEDIDCGGSCALCKNVNQLTCNNNGVQDGDETGIDCGGSRCAACECTVGEPDASCSMPVTACAGTQTCVSGRWSECVDTFPSDGCPVLGDTITVQNGLVVPNYGLYNEQVDSCIGSASQGTTYSSECTMLDSRYRALYNFDLSGIIDGKTIVNAELTLQEFNTGTLANTNMTVYPLTQSWNPSTVTWNYFSTPGGSIDSSLGRRTYVANMQPAVFDITPIVQAWVAGMPNYGLILFDEAGGGWITFRNGTYVPESERPKLTITFASSGPVTFVYDFDGDTDVDILDLYELILNFGSSTSSGNYVSSRDYNSDGRINIQDLVIHLQHWT